MNVMADDISAAAEAVINERNKRMQPVQFDHRISEAAFATTDELTRIRFELTAIRQLMERAAK